MPEEDTEWDLKGPDQDPMEDFGISPPRKSASLRRREEEKEYMEGLRRGLRGGAYVEESRCGHLNFEEEMNMEACGTHGGRLWEPRSPSRPAVMGAAVWEDLKDIRPPMYYRNPVNLDCILEKLDDWGRTVTEDIKPAAAGKYVFKRFRLPLPGVLQELNFVAAKEGEDQNPQGGQEVAQRAGTGGRHAGCRQEVVSHGASA